MRRLPRSIPLTYSPQSGRWLDVGILELSDSLCELRLEKFGVEVKLGKLEVCLASTRRLKSNGFRADPPAGGASFCMSFCVFHLCLRDGFTASVAFGSVDLT